MSEALASEPGLARAVTFVAPAARRGEGLPEYATYFRADVEAAAADINERWGTSDWEPILLETDDDFPRSIAALALADVVLVNPVRDGLNLVAKEQAIVSERCGVLVLSTVRPAPGTSSADSGKDRRQPLRRPRHRPSAPRRAVDGRRRARAPAPGDAPGDPRAHPARLARRPARERGPLRAARQACEAAEQRRRAFGPLDDQVGAGEQLRRRLVAAHRDSNGAGSRERARSSSASKAGRSPWSSPRKQTARNRRPRCSARPTAPSMTEPLSASRGGCSSIDIRASRTRRPDRSPPLACWPRSHRRLETRIAAVVERERW